METYFTEFHNQIRESNVHMKFFFVNRELQLQLYFKKKILDSTKRTDPQIALANLGGTVTQEDYNEINKYTKFTKETSIMITYTDCISIKSLLNR